MSAKREVYCGQCGYEPPCIYGKCIEVNPKETYNMAWPPTKKNTDSLGVIAEVITNATYGEVMKLSTSLASVIPIGEGRDAKSIAEALHKWATDQTSPAALLAGAMATKIPDDGKSS